MKPSYARRYRDPIYGYIYIPHELIDLVDSPFVTRLRRISQNGCGHIAYPSLTGSRYEHALGVMHLAMRAWDHAWTNSLHDVRHQLALQVYKDLSEYGADPYFAPFLEEAPNATEADWESKFGAAMRVCVGAAALLHDVGHGPFSHTLEPVFDEFQARIFDAETLAEFAAIVDESPGLQFHEICGQILATQALLSTNNKISVWITQQIIRGSRSNVRRRYAWAGAIHRIISGYIDVDRLDYLIRDSSRAGTEFGAIDVERILESISIQRKTAPESGWSIGFGSRATSAIETLLTNRERAYRWVYFHASALAADTALQRLTTALFAREQFDLTEFDFVSNWGTDTPYTGSIWVDDASIIRFLNHSMDSLAAEDREADRLRALHRIALIGDRSVYFAWRSFEELITAIAAKGVEWQMQLSNRKAEADALGIATAKRTWDASEQSTSATLNAIAKLRLVNEIDAEQRTESVLNEKHPEVAGVAGTWMVTHRLMFSTKNSDVELWHNGAAIKLGRLSPSASGLDEAETLRLKLWACFIPTVRDDYRVRDREMIGSEVADVFLSEFIGPTAEAQTTGQSTSQEDHSHA